MIAILFVGCVGTFSHLGAYKYGCGGKFVFLSGDTPNSWMYFQYTSKTCAENRERNRAEVSFREPSEVFQSVYVSINHFVPTSITEEHNLLRFTDHYEMIVLKNGNPIYREKSGRVQLKNVYEGYGENSDQVRREYMSVMTWVDRENIELPVEIVIVQFRSPITFIENISRIAHYRIDPEDAYSLFHHRKH